MVDETREIVGVDEAHLFQTMDSIANAMSDSCKPQIVPEIEPYMIEGKTEANEEALPKFKFRKLMIDEFKNVLMPEIEPLID